MTKLNDEIKYVLPSGIEIKLAAIPPFVLHAVATSNKNAPQPPYHKERIGGKERVTQNYHDPDYLAAKQEFESARNARVMQVMFCEGVKGTATDYIKDEAYLSKVYNLATMVYGDDLSEDDIKYIWLSYELKTDEDASAFQEAIQSISVATDEAIEESKSGV